MKPTIVILGVSVMVSGCLGESASQTSRQDRRADAEERLSQTPRPRVFRYADGELRVLEVPVGVRQGYLEQKQCFIWRDLELKTSSISCVMPGPVVSIDER